MGRTASAIALPKAKDTGFREVSLSNWVLLGMHSAPRDSQRQESAPADAMDNLSGGYFLGVHG